MGSERGAPASVGGPLDSDTKFDGITAETDHRTDGYQSSSALNSPTSAGIGKPYRECSAIVDGQLGVARRGERMNEQMNEQMNKTDERTDDKQVRTYRAIKWGRWVRWLVFVIR